MNTLSGIKGRWLFALAVAIFLAGCSAAGVLATSDPAKKLAQARTLLELGRPIPAQRSIQEAIDIYSRQNNLSGLGEAYAVYAEFHHSRAYHSHKAFFEQYGEYDSTLNTTIRYFGKAKESYLAGEDYAGASNIAFRLGLLYTSIGEPEQACTAYDESLSYHHESRLRRPDERYVLPAGFSNMDEVICAYKAKAGCCEELKPINSDTDTERP